MTSEIEQQIIDTLDKVKPFIQRDGGDVEFVKYDEKTGIVYIRMLGACQGCAFIDGTISLGIETILVEECKGVTKVELVVE